MDDRTRSLLDGARESYQLGQYEKAERVLVPLARKRVPFADVYAMLGVIYHHRDRLQDALTMLEEALRLNPGYTEAAVHLALTYNELGKYDEARRAYERMVANRKNTGSDGLDPFVKGKIANMHADVALAYEQAGLYEEAANEYARALALCPSYVDLRTRLGMALRAAGNFGAAEREFQKAKQENPNHLGPRLQLGLTFYAAGRPTEAAREWREVLAMEPENRFARLYMRMLNDSGNRGRGPFA